MAFVCFPAREMKIYASAVTATVGNGRILWARLQL